MPDVTSTCGTAVLSTVLRCLSMEFGNYFECIHRVLAVPRIFGGPSGQLMHNFC